MADQRIYIAIETFLPLVGGAERQALQQGQYMRECGIETTIVTMSHHRCCPACERMDDVPVLRVAQRILRWRTRLPALLRRICYVLALLVLGWQLWRRRHHFDIIYAFQLTLFTLPIILVCSLARKPLVVALRCDSSEDAQSKFSQSWSDLDALTRLGAPVVRLAAYQLCRMQACLTVLSSRMGERVRRSGIGGVRTVLIPNGVDSERFLPSTWSPETAQMVICVAKLRYQKGIDLLLDAWSQVQPQFPAARLLIVGDGPLLEPLQELAIHLGVAQSVEFVGLCSDVREQLRRSSIAVLPSRWEGMPNALLEAMSCGLACIATRVSGSEDIIEHGVNGFLVEAEQPQQLTEALLGFLSQPDLAWHCGQAARRSIEARYTLERTMYQYLDLFSELSERAHSHRKEKLA